jgi:Cdc6-like AAA superfamily ATPase
MNFDTLRIDKKLKKRLKEAFDRRVEMRVRSRLAQNRLSMEDFTPEELEIIYEDERVRLADELKSKGLIALLAALGLSLF